MYYLLVLAVGLERIAELLVSTRNARWSFTQGGKEFGRSHYPVMVFIHTALLAGCLVEPWALHRPFLGWLGWPMLAVVAATQGLRWWCITTLGRRWNTRVIVLPQARWCATAPTVGCTIRTMLQWWPKDWRCRWYTRRGSQRRCSRWPTPRC